MNTQYERDLPAWWWIGVPLLMVIVTIAAFLNSPEAMLSLVRKDTNAQGGGLAEHATVLILVPGIIAGIAATLRHRQRLPAWVIGWVLAWTLASIYFGGEEASWGQHYLNWSTPAAFKELNDQQETNLHNIGTWFDQKPRTLVELWVVIAGLLLPLWRRLRPRPAFATRDWRHWVLPTHVGTVAAGTFLASLVLNTIVKRFDWTDYMHIGSNELREYYIAAFMSTYLLSIWYRLRQQS